MIKHALHTLLFNVFVFIGYFEEFMSRALEFKVSCYCSREFSNNNKLKVIYD